LRNVTRLYMPRFSAAGDGMSNMGKMAEMPNAEDD